MAKPGTLVLYKAASDLAGRLSSFVILAMAARVLPPADFGILSLAVTAGWITSVATDFGLQVYLARAIARDPQRAGRTLWPLLDLRLILALIGAVLIVVSAMLAPAARPAALGFTLVALSYVAASVVEFLNYAFRGLGRSEHESSINLAQRIGALAAALVLLWVVPSIAAVGVALLVSALAAYFFSTAKLSALAPRPRGVTVERPGVRWSVIAPMGVATLVSALYFRIDLFLVEAWRGTVDVARYSAAFRLLDALRLFPSAVLTVAMPMIFGGTDRRFGLRVSLWLGALGAALAVPLYFAAPIVMPLAFGPAYAASTPLFQILLFALPLLSLNYGLTHQIIALDGQRAWAWMCVAALAVNLALNAALIPRLGAEGAAWTTGATELVLTLACAFQLARRRALSTRR